MKLTPEQVQELKEQAAKYSRLYYDAHDKGMKLNAHYFQGKRDGVLRTLEILGINYDTQGV